MAHTQYVAIYPGAISAVVVSVSLETRQKRNAKLHARESNVALTPPAKPKETKLSVNAIVAIPTTQMTLPLDAWIWTNVPKVMVHQACAVQAPYAGTWTGLILASVRRVLKGIHRPAV